MSAARTRRKQRRKHDRAISAAVQTRFLRLQAEDGIRIEASSPDDGDAQPKFRMIAYTGKPMRLMGFAHPVVVDLDGVEPVAENLPVRLQHDRMEGVGHTERIAVEDGRLIAEGVISRDTDAAHEVVASARRGFPWQASIGASIDKIEFVESGKSRRINGQEIKGPLLVATRVSLEEISFVDLGADTSTSARVAAQRVDGAGDADMEDAMTTDVTQDRDDNPAVANDIEQITAQARAEADRRRRIREMTAQVLAERPEMVDHIERLASAAIEAGWKPDKYELEVMRLGRSYGGIGGPRGRDNCINERVIEAALCISGSMEYDRLVAEYDEQTLDLAERQFRGGIGLQELLLICARERGYHGRGGRGEIRDMLHAAFHGHIEAASQFSTLSLPGIFSNTANKFLRVGFESVERTWRDVSAIGSVRDFKQVERYTLTGDMKYEPVAPDGELKSASVAELKYTNKAETYGKVFAITREDIINDDLGALTSVPRRLGRGAALQLNEVFWTEFLNNATFFSAANNNYADGVSTAFGLDALEQANQLFLDQTDPDGHPLGVVPRILLVPNALVVSARQIMSSQEIRDPNTKSPVANPFVGEFRVVRSSYLSNATISGSSSKAWYLLADPNDLPVIETVFLDGRESPTVETAEADFNRLGVLMRGYHDFGVSKQEFRGGVKMKGEA